MLQLSLGPRHAWRDNGTLTFWEVKTRLCLRTGLLQAAASRSEGQYTLLGVRINWETTPSDRQLQKEKDKEFWTLLHSQGRMGVEISLTASLHERLLLPHLVFTSRPLKDSSQPPRKQLAQCPPAPSIPGEAQVWVSQPVMWLHWHRGCRLSWLKKHTGLLHRASEKQKLNECKLASCTKLQWDKEEIADDHVTYPTGIKTNTGIWGRKQLQRVNTGGCKYLHGEQVSKCDIWQRKEMALGGTRDQRKISNRAGRRLKARAADTQPNPGWASVIPWKRHGSEHSNHGGNRNPAAPRTCANRGHQRERKNPAKVGLGKRNQKQVQAN